MNSQPQDKNDYGATRVPEAKVEIDPEVKKAERINADSKPFLQIERHTIQSPFIPPEHLQDYERILPGMGKELMQVIIKHQNFQMEIKKAELDLNEKSFNESVKINDANIREQDALNIARSREIDIKARGQVFALVITIMLLLSAFGFALLDLPILAGSCIAIIVAMSAVIFLQKTHHNKADGEASKTQDQEEG